jgi:hypothetical protein
LLQREYVRYWQNDSLRIKRERNLLRHS